jgi:hypothetical protein
MNTLATPRFWAGPIRYCRWAARERPAYFWSVIIGAAGPISMFIIPPLRQRFGDPDAPPIPQTYPSTYRLAPPSHEVVALRRLLKR